MENRKKKVIIIVAILVIVAIMGISFAWFIFRKDTASRKLVAGNIYFDLVDSSDTINLVGALPETEQDARNPFYHDLEDETNNTMTFTIQGDNPSVRDLYYQIMLNHGDDEENLIRFKDQHLRFDLIELDENDEEITPYLVSAQNYVDLHNETIYVSHVPAGASNYSKKYKLRMWIDYSVLVSDTNPKADYPETGANAYGNHFASIKVTVKGDLSQKGNPENLYNRIVALSTDELGSTYVKSYTETVLNDNPTFTIQDTVLDITPENRKEVYYFTGDNAVTYGNLVFAGFCWQIVRTTQDGGVKILYNGKAENNQCLDTRASDVQINGTANQNYPTASKNFNNRMYSYGTGFTYSKEAKTFTLTDYQDATWTENDTDNDGEADYKALIGKYTCMGGESCGTLYYVGNIRENGEPAYVAYTIGNGNANTQRVIGTSPFNVMNMPSMLGYMFNGTVHPGSNNNNDNAMTESTFGGNVTYDGTNYHLTLTDIGVSEGRHYRCEDGTVTECSVVRYYYGQNENDYYYIHLRNGETIESVMKEMFNIPLNDEDNVEVNVNRYNSSMKGLLENWYAKNLLAYNGYIDKETVYCNARRITSAANFGGWIRGNALTGNMNFTGSANKNLYCVQESDRFSVNNEKAKLTYPIGLLTENERQLMGANYAKTGQYWWLASPYCFYTNGNANERFVNTTGDSYRNVVTSGYGARPLVSLAPGVNVLAGTGEVDNPYIVGETK